LNSGFKNGRNGLRECYGWWVLIGGRFNFADSCREPVRNGDGFGVVIWRGGFNVEIGKPVGARECWVSYLRWRRFAIALKDAVTRLCGEFYFGAMETISDREVAVDCMPFVVGAVGAVKFCRVSVVGRDGYLVSSEEIGVVTIVKKVCMGWTRGYGNRNKYSFWFLLVPVIDEISGVNQMDVFVVVDEVGRAWGGG
jgi:hypothetical protein